MKVKKKCVRNGKVPDAAARPGNRTYVDKQQSEMVNLGLKGREVRRIVVPRVCFLTRCVEGVGKHGHPADTELWMRISRQRPQDKQLYSRMVIIIPVRYSSSALLALRFSKKPNERHQGFIPITLLEPRPSNTPTINDLPCSQILERNLPWTNPHDRPIYLE